MTVEDLKNLPDLYNKIIFFVEKISSLKKITDDLKLYPIQSFKDRVPSSSSNFSNPTANIAILIADEISDLETQLYELIEQYKITKKHCSEIIYQIPNLNEQRILTFHYCLNLSVDLIAERIGFSKSWVLHLRKKALDRFDSICKSTEKQ